MYLRLTSAFVYIRWQQAVMVVLSASMNETDLLERALSWIANDPDPDTKAELQALVDRAGEGGDAGAKGLREITERMAGPLRFGTAGLRGMLGAGEHRMNRAVIIRTTAGLARYIRSVNKDACSQGVVIGFDGRRLSKRFSRDAAAVLTGEGIKAYLFPELVPTPLTAFAINDLGAAAGIMITASHNPPEYNGYKVYWSNGALITPPHDSGIAVAIDTVEPATQVTRLDLDEARAFGLLQDVSKELIERYLKAVTALSVDGRGRELIRIVYTAMHGVGDWFTREALDRFGFKTVWSVPEQREPDGEFPTVQFPNPEEEGALDLSLSLAATKGANLVIANDPDADRLAVAVPSGCGSTFRQLTGNEIGVLIGEYLLRKVAPDDEQRLVVTTVVSSPLLGQIAKKFGVMYAEVLTGFKWIVTTAMGFEDREGARFIFGYEEALGYTVGDVTRDKDGVSGAAVFAELTAVAAAEGRSIEDELERLARSYGLFLSDQRSLVRKGPQGAAEIASMMDQLRKKPPRAIGGDGVIAVRDFQAGLEHRDGRSRPIDLPKSNVMAFDLESGARVIARPSGTEPKLKFYFDLREEVSPREAFDTTQARARARLDALVSAFLDRIS